MATIEVNASDLKPGDVVVRYTQFGKVLIERSEPDKEKIYSLSHPVRGSLLIKENGVGYWHAFQIVSENGRTWDRFSEEYDISPDRLRPIATREGF